MRQPASCDVGSLLQIVISSDDGSQCRQALSNDRPLDEGVGLKDIGAFLILTFFDVSRTLRSVSSLTDSPL